MLDKITFIVIIILIALFASACNSTGTKLNMQMLQKQEINTQNINEAQQNTQTIKQAQFNQFHFGSAATTRPYEKLPPPLRVAAFVLSPITNNEMNLVLAEFIDTKDGKETIEKTYTFINPQHNKYNDNKQIKLQTEVFNHSAILTFNIMQDTDIQRTIAIPQAYIKPTNILPNSTIDYNGLWQVKNQTNQITQNGDFNLQVNFKNLTLSKNSMQGELFNNNIKIANLQGGDISEQGNELYFDNLQILPVGKQQLNFHPLFGLFAGTEAQEIVGVGSGDGEIITLHGRAK